MTHRGRCLLFLIITAVLWSLSGVLVKSIDWNPLAISSTRSLVAAVTIACLTRTRPRLLGFSRLQWLAAFFLAMVSVTFVSATKLTTAANAILLQYTAPIWVAMLAPLILRERTSGRDWLFMAAAFGGMALFFRDSLSLDGFWGNILGIASGVFFAALAMATRYIKDAQPAQAMVLGNFITFIIGAWFLRPPWPGPGDIALLLIAGVFQFGFSYYLFTLAASGVTSLEIVLIPIVEPILSPIWVYLVIGERPGYWALVGGAIVLLTVTFWGILKAVRPDLPPVRAENEA